MPKGADCNTVGIFAWGSVRDALKKTSKETCDNAGRLIATLTKIVIGLQADEEWVNGVKRCCNSVPTRLEGITKNGGKQIIEKPWKVRSAK